MTVTDTIREAVKRDPRSQVDIARASGLSETHLNHFVAGRRGLTCQPLNALAIALGLTVVSEKCPHPSEREAM